MYRSSSDAELNTNLSETFEQQARQRTPPVSREMLKLIFVAVAFWGIIAATWFLSNLVGGRILGLHEKNRISDLGQLRVYRAADAALRPDPRRVVFFGDSITYGWDLTHSFPAADYVNRGIRGQTSADMLIRFRQDVIDLRPTTVVILAGINDFIEQNRLGNESMEEKRLDLESNLQTMAELAELHQIRPIFVSLLPLHAYTKRAQSVYKLVSPASVISTNRWLRDYCKLHDFQFIDDYSRMVDERGMLNREFSEDGIHPNGAGYAVMTQLFAAEYRPDAP